MKKQHIISIILTVAIILCSAATGAFARELQPDDKGERAVLIVTLDDDSLLDIVINSAGKYRNVRDLIISEEGRHFTDDILSAQDNIIADIGSRLCDADFTESRRCTALTNAFTVTAGISDIPKIKSIIGVRSVTISRLRKTAELSSEDSPEPQPEEDEEDSAPAEYDTIGLNYKNDANIVRAYEEGYTGKGMLIAVIDNEFDVNHDVFSGAPKEIKYDKDYVRSVAASSMLGISAKYSINDIFYNGKIIYAYDYAENDNKCYSKDTISHGTHVAGIAAGNNKNRGLLNYKGMAYDAQLALFKIGKKDNTLPDEALVAALDDALKLGPDVINCSYGSMEYLIQDYEGKQLYKKLMESGTAIIAAAGNDAYNGYALGLEEIPTSYVTYGTICNPSAMSGSLSVASSVPEKNYGTRMFFVFNKNHKPVDVNIVYSELTFDEVYPDLKSVESKELPEDSKVIDTVDYVYLDIKGTKAELSRYDLKDKMIILDESELTLNELIKNSVDSQCYAIIIIRKEKNSRFSTISPEEDFFIYSIAGSNREYLKKHPEGSLTIFSYSGYVTTDSEDPLTVSDYSSMGTLADLTLKPDITAPGTDIISSVRDHNFEKLSGTSMATPMMTGAYAILKQYVTQTGETELLSPQLGQEYIYKLLMSTARPLVYKTKTEQTFYSPRVQGAGLLDVYSAISTGAYLSYDEKRPSVSLREIKDGRFSFEFTLTNKSDKELAFTPDAVLLTDAYYKKTNKKTGEFRYLNTLRPEEITDKAEISFTSDGKPCDDITVPPGSSVVIGVNAALDSRFLSDRSIIFPNGFFTDGFISLYSDENPTLSIPFSGFCGDWSKGRIFPNNMYFDTDARDTGFPTARSTLDIVSTFNYSSYFKETAGKNVFGYKNLPYQISFGRNSLRSYLDIPADVSSAASMLLPSVYVMRDTFDFTISIFNEDNDLLYCENFGEISSYFGFAEGPYEQFVTDYDREKLERYNDFVSGLQEGNYRYMLTATTVGADGNPQRTESTSFTINVDNTLPQIDDYHLKKTDDGKLYLYVNAVDNHYIQGIRLSAVQHDGKGNVAGKIDMYEDILSYWGGNKGFVEYLYEPETRKFCFRYDLTKYSDFIKSKKEAQEQVYTDDDMTIIFKEENDYSCVEEDIILLEAVDDAYNCSKGQEINVNSYGEALLKFVDEDGRPVKGVILLALDCTRASNEEGLIPLRNLPLCTNSYRILCDYTLADGSLYAEFDLSKESSYTEKVFTVKKLEGDTDSSQGGSKNKDKQTYIINFPTGDSTPAVAALCITALGLSCSTVLYIRRKRTAKRKQ